MLIDLPCQPAYALPSEKMDAENCATCRKPQVISPRAKVWRVGLSFRTKSKVGCHCM
jgi:hypothetical protein